MFTDAGVAADNVIGFPEDGDDRGLRCAENLQQVYNDYYLCGDGPERSTSARDMLLRRPPNADDPPELDYDEDEVECRELGKSCARIAFFGKGCRQMVKETEEQPDQCSIDPERNPKTQIATPMTGDPTVVKPAFSRRRQWCWGRRFFVFVRISLFFVHIPAPLVFAALEG